MVLPFQQNVLKYDFGVPEVYIRDDRVPEYGEFRH
jgi:hypothetical protein